MDANKLKVLQDIGYTVHYTCGTCVHGRFAASQDFGVCAIQTYQHAKHTGDRRNLSIHESGSCSKLEPDEVAVAAKIGKTWMEFAR